MTQKTNLCSHEGTKSYPCVVMTVIVPVYRQWNHMPLLVEALNKQSMEQSKFEVVVVANECPPKDADDLKLPENWRMIICLDKGSYAARNAGLKIANAPLIAFTDADCCPQEEWLSTLHNALLNDPKQIVAGRIDMASSGVETIWSSYDLVRGIPQELYVSRGYGAGANLGVSQGIISAIGSFDSNRFSGGDAEFCRRARQLGFGIRYLNNAIVLHPARTRAIEVIRKARRIRGGQITSGAVIRRLQWIGLSAVPPLRESLRFLQRQGPIKIKAKALLVLYIIWIITLAETLRLLLGGKPERQ